MTPEQWQRVKSLFDRMLDQPADARDGFVDAAGRMAACSASLNFRWRWLSASNSFLLKAAGISPLGRWPAPISRCPSSCAIA